MIRRSDDGSIQFQCDALCRSVFETGLAGGKVAFIRAKNAAAQAGWQHRGCATGWIQYCPACAAEADPASKTFMQNSTESGKEGFSLVDGDGAQLTDEVTMDDLQVEAEESSDVEDENDCD